LLVILAVRAFADANLRSVNPSGCHEFWLVSVDPNAVLVLQRRIECRMHGCHWDLQLGGIDLEDLGSGWYLESAQRYR